MFNHVLALIISRGKGRLSPLRPTHTHAQFYLHQPACLITIKSMPKAAYLKDVSFLYLKASKKKKEFISSSCRSNYCALANPVALEDRRCDIDPHRFFDFDVLAKTLRKHNFKTRTNYWIICVNFKSGVTREWQECNLIRLVFGRI